MGIPRAQVGAYPLIARIDHFGAVARFLLVGAGVAIFTPKLYGDAARVPGPSPPAPRSSARMVRRSGSWGSALAASLDPLYPLVEETPGRRHRETGSGPTRASTSLTDARADQRLGYSAGKLRGRRRTSYVRVRIRRCVHEHIQLGHGRRSCVLSGPDEEVDGDGV